jgi:hypothetical protein
MKDCDMFRLLHVAGAQPQDKSFAVPSTSHLSSPQPELSLFLALKFLVLSALQRQVMGRT